MYSLSYQGVRLTVLNGSEQMDIQVVWLETILRFTAFDLMGQPVDEVVIHKMMP